MIKSNRNGLTGIRNIPFVPIKGGNNFPNWSTPKSRQRGTRVIVTKGGLGIEIRQRAHHSRYFVESAGCDGRSSRTDQTQIHYGCATNGTPSEGIATGAPHDSRYRWEDRSRGPVSLKTRSASDSTKYCGVGLNAAYGNSSSGAAWGGSSNATWSVTYVRASLGTFFSADGGSSACRYF